MPPLPRLSVLSIGAHYPDADAFLDAILAQTAPRGDFEVILADTAAGTWQAAAREAQRAAPDLALTYLRTEVEGTWRARLHNEALARARGELVLFLAGDFIPAPGLIAAHLVFHVRHPEREAIGIGPGLFPPEQLESPLASWLEESGQLFGATARDEGSVPPEFFYVANASLKMGLLREAGPFDEDFVHDAWDDYEFGIRLLRAGSRSRFVPGAEARHQHGHPVTLAERIEQMGWAGEAAALFETKHPGPYPWAPKCAEAPWKLSYRAARARLRHLASRSRADLERSFETRLDAAFVSGYRRTRPLL